MFWRKKFLNRELVEYAEQEAKILAEFQIECVESLERASNTFMNLLLSGAGGALALSVSLHGKGSDDWLVFGTFGSSVYLFVLAGLILWKCLKARNLYPAANDPIHIYNKNSEKFRLIEIKYFELENRQKSINKNRDRNISCSSSDLIRQ